MNQMERQLDITITINEDGEFGVDVYEPESGDRIHYDFPFSPDEHPEFDQTIGNEIYSWVDLWREEFEEDGIEEDGID